MTDVENKPTTDSLVIAENRVVAFHYKMYDLDEAGKPNNCLENSHDGQAIYFLVGFKNIIPGLEAAMLGKKTGDTLSVSLDPIDAYGPRNADAIQRVPAKHLQFQKRPKKLVPGMIAGVKTEKGMRNVIIVKAGKFNVDVDFNHPFAGKDLHYEVEITLVREGTEEEIAHRHVHGDGGHQH